MNTTTIENIINTIGMYQDARSDLTDAHHALDEAQEVMDEVDKSIKKFRSKLVEFFGIEYEGTINKFIDMVLDNSVALDQLDELLSSIRKMGKDKNNDNKEFRNNDIPYKWVEDYNKGITLCDCDTTTPLTMKAVISMNPTDNKEFRDSNMWIPYKYRTTPSYIDDVKNGKYGRNYSILLVDADAHGFTFQPRMADDCSCMVEDIFYIRNDKIIMIDGQCEFTSYFDNY